MQITAHTPTVLGVSPFSAPLDSEWINARLENSYWRVKVVETTGSTQRDLVAKVHDLAASHGDVIATEFQRTGRGRLDRTFVTPSRSAILLSLYVEPKNYAEKWGWLPLLAGQAVCSAITKVLNLNKGEVPNLKWPNDILLNNKKVAGLLTERVESAVGPGVVIGIGINVNASQEELPTSHSTSFFVEGFQGTNRNQLLVEILNNFSEYFQRWEMNDPDLVTEYQIMSATIGKRVEIEMPGKPKVLSTAISIDASGALVLEDGRRITVGDVVHISAV